MARVNSSPSYHEATVRICDKCSPIFVIFLLYTVIPRLRDQAIINQTASKHLANIEQLEHTSCTCTLNAFVACFLDDCSMFAWSCKRGITQELLSWEGGPSSGSAPSSSAVQRFETGFLSTSGTLILLRLFVKPSRLIY